MPDARNPNLPAPIGNNNQSAVNHSPARWRDGNGNSGYGGSGNGGLNTRNGALSDPTSGMSNQFYYGQNIDAADQDVERYRALGEAMQQRQGIQANYGQADASGRDAQSARGDMVGALGMYRDAANGVGTSVAQAQFAQALDASQRAQASMANSARGGGLARAAAQQQAMAGAADMQQNSAGAAATLRAQEIAQARAGYAGAAGALRQGDQSQQSIYGQQAQSNAALADAQRARNDQAWQSAEQFGQGVRAAQQQGGQAIQHSIDTTNATAAGVGAASGSQDVAKSQQTQQTIGATIGAGAAIGAAALSDRREKQNIEAGDGNIRSFLNAISARDYEYRSPEVPGASPGRHTSVMAQDLEKTPVGRRMVEDGPDGRKRVNYNEHAATMLAAMASLNKRLAKVEGAEA